MDPNPTAQLHAAISAAQAEICAAQETCRNSHHGYDYANASALLTVVRPQLRAHGLGFFPAEDAQITSTQLGKSRVVTVRQVWLLTHSGGASVRITAFGEGAGNDDKAVYKALTGMQKYALRLVFAIPLGEDPEKTPNQAGHEELSRAYRDGKRDAVLDLIRQTATSGWTESGFLKQLKAAGSKCSLWEINMFLSWRGWPLLHAMEPARRDGFPGWLVGPQGRTEWAKFISEITPKEE
jgi:hypothetical protein